MSKPVAPDTPKTTTYALSARFSLSCIVIGSAGVSVCPVFTTPNHSTIVALSGPSAGDRETLAEPCQFTKLRLSETEVIVTGAGLYEKYSTTM